MLEICHLTQLVAVARNDTLSKAAEELHLSQSALSRSMKRIEEELQVTLFERQKNKITLNANGQEAVLYAEKVLNQLDLMVSHVRDFDRKSHTIALGSCAPAPVWEILPLLSSLYSGATISSELKEDDTLLQGLYDDVYQLIITPYPIESQDVLCKKYGEEHLYFSLPPAHPLSGSKGLHFRDLDGETILLFSKLGFWRRIHEDKMPSTHYLIQDERYDFDELVRNSALPSFTSDLVIRREGAPENRVIIPILDAEANVTYYCSCLNRHKADLDRLFQRMKS